MAAAALATPPAVDYAATRLVPLADLHPAPWNPRILRDVRFVELCASITADPQFLWDRPVLARPDGEVFAGNMRLRAAAHLGWAAVPARLVDIPAALAQARGLRDNNQWGEWDDQALAELVVGLDTAAVPLPTLGFSAVALSQLLDSVGALGEQAATVERAAVRGQQPDRRGTPLDAIFTLTPQHPLMAVAVDAGFQVGVRSSDYRGPGAYPVTFVDNEYRAYDHAAHCRVVAALRPKYATVRDVMTEAQCTAADVPYYPLARVLDWAAELAQWAERVVIIPKYDCLDAIPAAYVLGYSVESSYGATPLPAAAFAGRPVHLLGGTWALVRGYCALLGDDVVSLDTNLPYHAACYGTFYAPDGASRDLVDTLGYRVSNAQLVAVALSLGAMIWDMQQWGALPPAPEAA